MTDTGGCDDTDQQSDWAHQVHCDCGGKDGVWGDSDTTGKNGVEGEMWGHYLWDEDKDIFLCIQKTKRKENNAFQAKETGENLHTCKKKL